MIYNLLNELKRFPHLEIIALSMNEGTLTDKLRESGINVYVIPEEKNPFPIIYLKSLKMLRGKNLDIIHSHRYKENILAFFLKNTLKVRKLITTIHGLPEPSTNKKNSIDHKMRVNHFILKNSFQKIVSVSNNMKEALVKNYGFNPEKISVVYNGIPVLPPPQAIPPAQSHQFFHVGTVGRMVPVKDFDLFIEVASEIRKRIKNVRFSILGEGPLKNHLTEKAKVLRMNGNIEFLPQTPDPMPYYQSLDLYLNTSLNEGIPLSILEAMSCGVPVVAPKIGGIPEIIPDGEQGFLVSNRNPEEFAGCCLKIMQNKYLRNWFAENSYKRVSSFFNSLKMAESYMKIYQDTSIQNNTSCS
ncbi:MAG: glycosyltransferase family 4 protein [Nitrospirae bacterium]|nr:glycosyltransferase family 4 protein [Nitrospirota bacterium]